MSGIIETEEINGRGKSNFAGTVAKMKNTMEPFQFKEVPSIKLKNITVYQLSFFVWIDIDDSSGRRFGLRGECVMI